MSLLRPNIVRWRKLFLPKQTRSTSPTLGDDVLGNDVLSAIISRKFSTSSRPIKHEMISNGQLITAREAGESSTRLELLIISSPKGLLIAHFLLTT
jgi:hypothetical protein